MLVAPAQRIGGTGNVLQDHVEAGAVQQLEGRHGVAGLAAGAREQLGGGEHVAHRDEGGRRIERPRKQLHDRRSDQPERALRAHEQMLEVVAGVVLAQPAQPVPHLPVGQHDLEPEHEIAGIAVAQHGGAAGIGREIAADLAAAFGGEAEREQAIVLRRRGLQIGEDAARLDRHRVGQRIDVADPVHAAEADDDAAGGRHCAA